MPLTYTGRALGLSFEPLTAHRSLAEVSERLYRHMESDGEFGQRLLEFYDIPLLHFGLME